jgi:hypothetical protein
MTSPAQMKFLVLCTGLPDGEPRWKIIELYKTGRESKSDPRYEQFMRELLPKIGKKITFVGAVTPGKFGPFLTADRWDGIYVEMTTTNRADLVKLNEVGRYESHTLKVEGILHFAKEQPGPMINGMQAAGIVEHFYFDVGEIAFSEVTGPDEKPKTR